MTIVYETYLRHEAVIWHTREFFNPAIPYASDCVWMVPGTYDEGQS